MQRCLLQTYFGLLLGSWAVAAPFAQLDPADTPGGYLARLLINETPFPGERAYVSETEPQAAMLAILWVLHSRIHYIPAGCTQQQVAGVRSKDIIDVITGMGGRRQCEGFFRNAAGQFVAAPRVEEPIDHLLGIANSGGKPGRFAALITHGVLLGQRITVPPYVPPSEANPGVSRPGR